MSKILTKLESLAGTQCSALYSQGQSTFSTFPGEKSRYSKLAYQAFYHIFKHAHRVNIKYDEAHLQIGNERYICYQVAQECFYISVLPPKSDINKAQKVIRGAHKVLTKLHNSSVPT
jgi:hypothetical protein